MLRVQGKGVFQENVAAGAKCTLTRPKQLGFQCSEKTFPVEMLFFNLKDLHETDKKVSKMQHLCSESLLRTFTPTLLCCFFLPSLFPGLHFRAHSKTFETEMLFQNEMF